MDSVVLLHAITRTRKNEIPRLNIEQFNFYLKKIWFQPHLADVDAEACTPIWFSSWSPPLAGPARAAPRTMSRGLDSI
uniref:Uncharacterized protein n=1 Tax=Arundo donax TaxID=35708 RepID=A0A0A9CJT4_ARUDO